MRANNKRFFTFKNFLKVTLSIGLAWAFLLSLGITSAAFNPTINYQGKLADDTGVTVADGSYEMEFSLYTQATGGSPIWTETLDGSDEVDVVNGLFSIMLGSTTPLTGVNFNQTLYLGVTIDTDPEMSPRKVLGTVPAAFVAETANDASLLGGVASTSFLRSDQADVATGLLTFSNGFLSQASSSIARLTTITATTTNLVINGERFTDLTGTGLQNSGNTLSINTSYLNTLYASTSAFDTSAELLAILSDETGTGSVVFSASPTFTGTINASAATLSSTLTLSGTAANIALGSNWLSGDGDDEGVFVSSAGNVGIGTSVPTARIAIDGTASGLGSELITNGTFTGNASGWDLQTGCSDYSSNTVVVLYDAGCQAGANWAELSTTVSLTAGKLYRLSFDIVTNGDAPYVYFDNTGYGSDELTDGTHVLYVVGDYTGTDTLHIESWDWDTDTGWTIDNVSLREVPENPIFFARDFTGATSTVIGTALNNLILGRNALTGVLGADNVGIGTNAGYGATNANNSFFAGTNAGYGTIYTNGSVYIGLNAGYNATMDNSSNFLGTNAGYNATNTSHVNFLGSGAGYGATTAINSNFLGWNAGNSGTFAYSSNFFGEQAGMFATSSYQSNFLGMSSGYQAARAYQSNFLGSSAGYAATAANNSNFIGYEAGRQAENASYSTFIGYLAGRQATNAIASNFFGPQAGNSASNATYANFIGSLAGYNADNAYYSNFFGNQAGFQASAAAYSNFLGYNAGISASNATSSNFIGQSAGESATYSAYSNFIGRNAGYGALRATSSNFIGFNAGYNADNASNALFLGSFAGYNDTVNNTSNGGSSIAIGRYAGTGGFSNSIALGRGVINSSSTQLNIGNLLYGSNIYNSDTQSAAAVSAGRIGIGTSTPSQKLTVAGNLRVTGALYGSNNSAGSNGMVLQSTGSGFQWVATSSLGFGTSNFSTTQIDTSSEIAAIVGDETGTGRLVFSNAPAFSGTATFSGLTATSTMTLSGLTASRALFLDASNRATTTALSAALLNALTDETGTGSVVFSTAPTLTATTTVQGSFLVSGTTGGTPASGAGTRMMFVPSKGAFRAGTVTGTQWDATNIGNYSAAFGHDVIASAAGSFAMGYNLSGASTISATDWGAFAGGHIQGTGSNEITASEIGAFAFGYANGASTIDGHIIASGNGAIALGRAGGGSDGTIQSSGQGSLAAGYADGGRTLQASGDGAIALGRATNANLTATGAGAVALGQDVNATAANALSLGRGFTNSVADSFGIGFGSQQFTLRGASGNVGIGTTTPSYKLHLTATAGSNSLFAIASSSNARVLSVNAIQGGARLEVVGDIVSKGTKWATSSASQINSWTSITYGNGTFVAVSADGTNRVMTSPDGATWTMRTAAEANSWRGVTYGNGLFVAVSSDGTNQVMTSPDGITWTARAEAEANIWYSVTYGNGRFVAVSQDGTNRAMSSQDGITWTARSAAGNNDVWRNVTYGNGLFVAVGSSGDLVMTSPDGITWTARTAAEANAWYSVTYGNGLFVAVAGNGTNRVMTSPDGITWTARAATEASTWWSVTYGNGLFVAISNNGTNRVMTSPDGITWTARAAAAANTWYGVTYGNGRFVAVAIDGTNNVMTSGATEEYRLAQNNIYQGGITLLSGNLTIGTSTQSQELTIQGDARITGRIYDSANSAGTNGMVLKSTGTGFTWVATSTLGISGGGLTSADINTCSELAAILSGNTTGTCGSLVLSNSPTFTGTTNFSHLTATGILDFSTTSTSTLITLRGEKFLGASTAGYSTSLGYQALNAQSYELYDTAFGYQALMNDEAGDNTAVGYRALRANTSGINNVAVGEEVLLSNISGQRNTGLGNFALQTNRIGSYNVALGYQALYANATGSSNIAIGRDSLSGNLSGSRNISLGEYSLSGNNGTGTIAIGYQVGNNLTTGDRNILIGYDIDAPTATSDNILNIGNLLFGTGIDGTGTTLSSGNIGIGTSSPLARLTIVSPSSLSTTTSYQIGLQTLLSASTSSPYVVGNYVDVQHLSGNTEGNFTQVLGGGNGIYNHLLITEGGAAFNELVGIDNYVGDGEVAGSELYGVRQDIVGDNVGTTYGIYQEIQRNSYSTTSANIYGNYTDIYNGTNAASGFNTTYGDYINIWDGGSVGATFDTYGQYIEIAGETDGTTTAYGQYINVYGADTNYAAIYMGGNVGIGTSTPSQKLTVAGNLRVTGALYGSNNSAGSNGMVLQSTGSGFQWVATSTLGFGTGSVTGTGSSGRVAYWSGASALTSDSTFTFANSRLTAPVFNASGASTTVFSINNASFIVASSTLDSIALGFGAKINATSTAVGAFFVGDEAGWNAIDADAANFFGYRAGFNAAEASDSNFFGSEAGSGAVNASDSNFFGNSAGYGAIDVYDANFFGPYAGSEATDAFDSNFFGNSAGFQAAGASYSNFFGISAGGYASAANDSNFFGNSAGFQATNANNSNFFGYQAGRQATNAAASNFLGYSSGYQATNADYSNFLGYQTGYGSANATYANFLGFQSGYDAGGAFNSNFIGYESGRDATNSFYSNFIGDSAGYSASDAFYSNFIGVSAGGSADFAYNSNFIGYTAGYGATNAATSSFIGDRAGYGAINANNSNFMGTKAGEGATGAYESNFMGFEAGMNAATALDSNFIGIQAGKGAISAQVSNFIGSAAGQNATNSYQSNFIGSSAGEEATRAQYSNFIGYFTGYDADDAVYSNFLGWSAGDSATNAEYSNFIGYRAGNNAVNAADSIFIGTSAGRNDTVNNTSNGGSSIAIGRYAGTGGFSNSIAIGRGVRNSSTTQLNIGNLLYGSNIYNSDTQSAAAVSAGRIGIGTSTPSQKLTVAGNLRVTGSIYDSANSAGTNGMVLKSTGTGFTWVATSTLGIGGGASSFLTLSDVGVASFNDGRILFESATEVTDSASLTFANSKLTAPIFNASGASTTVMTYNGDVFLKSDGLSFPSNLSLGSNALLYATTSNATHNLAIGVVAQRYNRTGDFNIAIGATALESNATGSDNVAIGYQAGNQLLTSGNTAIGYSALANTYNWGGRNTAIGWRAGYGIESGSNNIAIGYGTGEVLDSGSNNILIGHDIEIQNEAWSNRLNIGNLLFGTGIDGTGTTLSSGNIGIGTSTPNQKLTIFNNGADAAIAFGTVSGANEKWTIGIDDSDGAKFKISSSSALGTNDRFVIDGAGRVGIGTSTPSQLLTVAGGVRITGALRDNSNSAGTNGMVLKSTGTGFTWVATSTLGFGTGTVTGSGSSGRVAYWSGASALTSDSTFTFANSKLTAPVFNASGASTTILSVNGDPLLLASTTNNYFLGFDAGNRTATGGDNFGVGYYALRALTTGDYNNAIGVLSMESNTTGSFNSAYGAETLNGNTVGSNNTALGYFALYDNTSGSRNVAIGDSSLWRNNGTGTIAIGYQAGDSLLTGDRNIIIGYDVDAPSTASDNILNIGNLLFGTGIDGTGTTLSSGSIGIGTSTPSQKLTVAGNLRVTGALYGSNNSAGSNGMVLQSTGTGFAWVATSTLGISGGGGLTGSGSANQVTYWSGASALTSSSTFTFANNKLTVPIFNTSGATTTVLSVNGASLMRAGVTTDSLSIGFGSAAALKAASYNNTIMGVRAFNVGTSTNNTIIGYESGYNTGTSTAADRLSFLGYQAGYRNSGDELSALGFQAGYLNRGAQSTAIGAYSGVRNTSLDFTGVGNSSGYDNTGVGVTALGSGSGLTNTGAYLTAVGRTAGYQNTGAYVTAVGASAAYQNTASSSSFLGYQAGQSNTGAYSTGLGAQAAMSNSGRFLTAVGMGAGNTNSRWYVTAVGYESGYQNTASSSSYLGYQSGYQNSGRDSTFMGVQSGYQNTGIGVTAFGYQAATQNTGNAATAIGNGAFRYRNASSSVALGHGAGFGSDLVRRSIANSTFVGFRSGYGITTGNNNLLLGYQAGDALTSGSNNIVIGYDIDLPSNTLSNRLNIGNLLFGTGIDGTGTTLSSGNIGIGTSTPNQRLTIFKNAGDAAIELSSASGANSKWTFGLDYSDGGKFKISSSSALGTNDRFVIDGAGRIGIGSTSPQSLLTLDKSSITGSVVAGIKEYFNFTNSTLDAIYYGDNTYIVNAPTATSTLVGNMLRIEDSTSKANTVRGMEVQAHRGTNSLGENTGLSAFGRTFGLRGTTEGDAGAVFQPAGVFAQTRGTAQGNALRAYSASITTEDLVSLFQDTSAFAGTGLVMNFGNTTGSFSSSTASKFVDFKNAGTSKFIVGNHGMTTIGDGTTNNNAGLQIGYGGICVDNDGACVASTTGKITSMTSAVGHSDLAEMYFSSETLEPGEIVYSKGVLSIGKADEDTKGRVLGVVSTNPGLVMGFDDKSLTPNQKGYPIALKGRVPIKLSTENGPIKVGDPIALSSIPGVGMKALESDIVVGTALEDFDGEYAYSEGFVIQFGDNIAEPDTTPDSVTTDKRVNDGCYFGGGTELGEKKCKPHNIARFATIQTQTLDESEPMREALLEMAQEEPLETKTPDGKEVKIGQALMFVGLGWHQNVHETTMLAELVSTSTDLVLDGDGEETLWSRIKTLAQGFVDGVLSVAGINTRELCLKDDSGSTCIDRQELNALLQNAQNSHNNSDDEEHENDEQDPEPEPIPEPEPEPTPEPDPIVEEPDTEEPIVEAQPEEVIEEPSV